jgi:hypothetical protein
MPTEKNIKTPEALYEQFEAYKTLCKSNPKKENFWSSKSDKEVSVSREIPLTWNGFELYLRKEKVLCKLDDYKANKDGRYTEYADIIHVIDIEIYEDKFSGAVAGIFQHNIIARDLGLVEKKENDNKHTFEDKAAIESWLDRFSPKVDPNNVDKI